MLLLITITIFLRCSESAKTTSNLQVNSILLYQSSQTALTHSQFVYTFPTAFNGTPKVVFGISQMQTRLSGYFYSKYLTSASNISFIGMTIVVDTEGSDSNVYLLKVSVLACYNSSYLDIASHSIIGLTNISLSSGYRTITTSYNRTFANSNVKALTFITGYQLQFVSLYAYKMEVTASVDNLTHYTIVAAVDFIALVYRLSYFVLFCDTININSGLDMLAETVMLVNASSKSLDIQTFNKFVVLSGVSAVEGSSYVSNTIWGWNFSNDQSAINVSTSSIISSSFSVLVIGVIDSNSSSNSTGGNNGTQTPSNNTNTSFNGTLPNDSNSSTIPEQIVDQSQQLGMGFIISLSVGAGIIVGVLLVLLRRHCRNRSRVYNISKDPSMETIQELPDISY